MEGGQRLFRVMYPLWAFSFLELLGTQSRSGEGVNSVRHHCASLRPMSDSWYCLAEIFGEIRGLRKELLQILPLE